MQQKVSSVTQTKRKSVSWAAFHELNGDRQPIVGNKYRLARTTGAVEDWVLVHIDPANRMLVFVSY